MTGMTDCFELECLLSGPLGGRRPGAGLSITTIRLFSFRLVKWIWLRVKELRRLNWIQIVLCRRRRVMSEEQRCSDESESGKGGTKGMAPNAGCPSLQSLRCCANGHGAGEATAQEIQLVRWFKGGPLHVGRQALPS